MHSRIIEISTDPNHEIVGQDFLFEMLDGSGIDYIIQQDTCDMGEAIIWFTDSYGIRVDENETDYSFVASPENIIKLINAYKDQVNKNYELISKYVKTLNRKRKDPIKGFCATDKLYAPFLKDEYDLIFYEPSNYGVMRTLDRFIRMMIEFKDKKLFVIATYDYHY